MGAATKEKPAPPFYSGFCGLRLPAESHARCRGGYGDTPCSCTCHVVVEPPAPAGWLQTMSASKVAAMVGLSPWESRFSLWHRMAGLLPAEEDSPQKSRGQYLEAGVLAWFRDQHPDWTVVTAHQRMPDRWVTLPDGRDHPVWVHPTEPRFTASPDGFVLADDDEALVEVKTAKDVEEWGAHGTDAIPPYYRAQVQWQMGVLRRQRTHVAVLTCYLELREYVVPFDREDFAFLAEEARAFLDSLPGGPAEQRPDVDAHGATYEAVRQLHPDIDGTDVEVDEQLATAYQVADAAAKQADAELKRAKAALLDRMGNARRALVDSTPIARRQPSRYGVSLVNLKPKDQAA